MKNSVLVAGAFGGLETLNPGEHLQQMLGEHLEDLFQTPPWLEHITNHIPQLKLPGLNALPNAASARVLTHLTHEIRTVLQSPIESFVYDASIRQLQRTGDHYRFMPEFQLVIPPGPFGRTGPLSNALKFKFGMDVKVDQVEVNNQTKYRVRIGDEYLQALTTQYSSESGAKGKPKPVGIGASVRNRVKLEGGRVVGAYDEYLVDSHDDAIRLVKDAVDGLIASKVRDIFVGALGAAGVPAAQDALQSIATENKETENLKSRTWNASGDINGVFLRASRAMSLGLRQTAPLPGTGKISLTRGIEKDLRYDVTPTTEIRRGKNFVVKEWRLDPSRSMKEGVTVSQSVPSMKLGGKFTGIYEQEPFAIKVEQKWDKPDDKGPPDSGKVVITVRPHTWGGLPELLGGVRMPNTRTTDLEIMEWTLEAKNPEQLQMFINMCHAGRFRAAVDFLKTSEVTLSKHQQTEKVNHYKPEASFETSVGFKKLKLGLPLSGALEIRGNLTVNTEDPKVSHPHDLTELYPWLPFAWQKLN